MLGETFVLRPFDRLHAPTVAGWVRDAAELFWLAPSTEPPLTPRKVVAWTRPQDRPLLLFAGGQVEPCGYGELNPLKGSTSQLWVGHVVVAPAVRGHGIGRRLTRMLAETAFAEPRIERLVMVVFPQNHAALRCYRGSGFRTTAREHHRFATRPQTHLMLRLELDRQSFAACLSGPAAQELRADRPIPPPAENPPGSD